MRVYPAVVLVLVLLILAAVPWIVSSCAPYPLLPDPLREEPLHFTETVKAARTATIGAERKGTSAVKVIPLGTLSLEAEDGSTPTVVTDTPTPESPSPPPVPSSTLESTATPAPIEATSQPTERVTSKITVRTAVLTQTVQATGTSIIIRRTTSPDSPIPPPTTTETAFASPVPPQGLVDVEDVITEDMLTAQVEQDGNDTSISDLNIHLTPDGVVATGRVSVLPGIKRPIEVKGTFAVENDSLVMKVTSILLNDIDVTDQYRVQLEDEVGWSLYQLLPQRYVRSYELAEGQLIVHSEVRP